MKKFFAFLLGKTLSYNVRHAKNGHLEDEKMEKTLTIRLSTEEMEMVEKIAEKMRKKDPYKKITNSDAVRKAIRQTNKKYRL